MKYILGLLALTVLVSCSNFEKSATYLCLNGPDLIVTTSEDQVVLLFPGGRSETVPLVDPARPGFYAAPGISWSITGFRAARLNDDQKSFGCDEVG